MIDKSQQKAEKVWIRDLLKTWFCKQYTNRRTERLKAGQVRVAHCSHCSSKLVCMHCEMGKAKSSDITAESKIAVFSDKSVH